MLRRAYRQLFLERIQAIINRLNSAIGELISLRAELRAVSERQDALDRHAQTVIAGQTEAAALAQRLAAVEDRLQDGALLVESPQQRSVEVREPLWPTAEQAAASPTVFNRFPAGHYYSALPDTRELAAEPNRSRVWPPLPRATLELDWRDDEQAALCRDVFAAQKRLAFATRPGSDEAAYFADNDQYPILDAWLLEAFLRHLRPRRMIEVGCGFSTLVSARVNRELLDGSMRLTCIEPHPRDFLTGVDGLFELRTELVQDTPLELFEALAADDVLFIDSSHVAKAGSDVVWLFEEVLPRLAVGVVVHVHDVFVPGDYPQAWVLDGWGWNEIYLVRAFLAYNAAFRIELGAARMCQHNTAALLEAFPGLADPAAAARGGGSLWLRRVA